MRLSFVSTASNLAPQQPAAAETGGRVLIATLNRLEGVTGVHAHTRSLSDGLRKAGVACDVVTPFDGSPLWLPVFAVRPLLLSRVYPTGATLWHRAWHMAALRTALRRELSRRAVTHIIAQCPPSAQAAMDACEDFPAARRPKVTMVCHFNRGEADEYREQGVLNDRAYARVARFEETVIRAVDQVIYVSSWARRLVETERDIQSRSSTVIWNGVDRVESDGGLTRPSLGLNDAHLVLISVGTLEPRKDQVGLVRLFSQVLNEFPHARLLLAGEGPDRPRIEAAINQLNLEGRITLLGHRADVPALLRLSDVYVHHASLENCPIALLEASAAGLPWAAKPVGGVTELLEGESGGVALDDDPQRSLRALRPLLTYGGRRVEMGRLARRRFERQFTQQAMTRAYFDALGIAGGGAA